MRRKEPKYYYASVYERFPIIKWQKCECCGEEVKLEKMYEVTFHNDMYFNYQRPFFICKKCALKKIIGDSYMPVLIRSDIMNIIEKQYPTGKNAMCGDIIITNDNEYLLIGWDYHSQKAITIDVKKTTNNVKIFEYMNEIREKYANCRVIPAGEITMTFFE